MRMRGDSVRNVFHKHKLELFSNKQPIGLQGSVLTIVPSEYSRPLLYHGRWGSQPVDRVLGGREARRSTIGLAIIGSPRIQLDFHHLLRLHTTVYSHKCCQ